MEWCCIWNDVSEKLKVESEVPIAIGMKVENGGRILKVKSGLFGRSRF